MLYLGVDGGGTKTQVLLANEKGKILSSSVVGPTYIRTLSPEEIGQTLEEGVAKALEAYKAESGAPVVVEKSCFGIAGLDHPSDYAMVAKVLRTFKRVELDASPLIVNDVVCALRRGTDKGFGISVVAGTGSHCFGRNKKGEEAHAGGLGHILSDEGGSYFVGLNVLKSAARSSDGRDTPTLLESMIYEYFGVVGIRDVLLKIHEKKFGKREVAALAVVCEKAAEKGDLKAIEILENAAEELLLMVKTVALKLEMSSISFDLVCVGGSFKKIDGPLRSTFETGIHKALPNAEILYPSNEPAMGAVFLAIDQKNFNKGSHLNSVK